MLVQLTEKLNDAKSNYQPIQYIQLSRMSTNPPKLKMLQKMAGQDKSVHQEENPTFEMTNAK